MADTRNTAANDAHAANDATARTWIPFAEQQAGKRKRAEAVCVPCHSRKIKCDVQTRSQHGHRQCSHCHAADRRCDIRPSQRGKRKRSVAEAAAAPRPLDISEAGGGGGGGAGYTCTIDGPASVAGDSSNISPAAARQMQGVADSAFSIAPQGTPIDSVAGIGTNRSHENDVDAGYLQVYGPENQFDAEMQEIQAQLAPAQQGDHALSLDPNLRSTFLETYLECCYCFCPVLDRATAVADMARSPMLTNALALAASHVKPPLLPHDGPEAYYDRARRLFYNDRETDNMMALKALSLFYWWAPRPPSTTHRHTSWWWQSVIIRHAQQMGIHREPPPDSPLHSRLDLSLRRRIWWTAFARERLTALCQSKPTIIDEADCTISHPRLSDFPDSLPEQRKGLIFIHWVRLCRILGRMAKSSTGSASASFYLGAARDLADWIRDLPSEISLRLDDAAVPAAFDPDVYQLHLPYLTAVVLLHLQRSAHDLPQALPPAILAASCTARIMRNILARGNARFMMAISCWYSGTAFIALLQGSRIQQFAEEAEDGIAVLLCMVEQLQKMWPSANVIRQGFDRLRGHVPNEPLGHIQPTQINGQKNLTTPALNVDSRRQGMGGSDNVDWTAVLPFATASSNKIAECLVRNQQSGNITRGMPSPANTSFYENVMNEYNDFLDPLFTDFQADLSDLSLFQV